MARLYAIPEVLLCNATPQVGTPELKKKKHLLPTNSGIANNVRTGMILRLVISNTLNRLPTDYRSLKQDLTANPRPLPSAAPACRSLTGL